jgi:hypothetical protein
VDMTLITEEEAARALGLSIRTLQAWRVRGGGPSFVKLGASVRYRRDVVIAFITDRSRETTSDVLYPVNVRIANRSLEPEATR